MSTIDKMLIKGIRSFSPENNDVIIFFKPLTLIVGSNGAGKTTIIECLKHACTGELPPNARSGQSFVHDPKKVCMSYRCADIDREVPKLMGVSKAILENVIFVHQDEANWPLAEAAVLKKKFDDVFSATRYTKALEAIKKLHKDQAQLIKEYKLKLDHLSSIKDAAMKLRKAMDEDSKEAEKLRAQMAEYQRKIAALQAKREAAEQTIVELRNLQEEMKLQEEKRKSIVQQINQLQSQMHAFTEADEELEKAHENLDKVVKGWQQDQVVLGQKQADLKIGLETAKESYTKDCQIKGRLQADAEAFASNKQERDNHLRATAARHNLGHVDTGPLSTDTAEEFTSKAMQRLSDLQLMLKTVKAENDAKDKRLEKQVDDMKRHVFQAESTIQARKKQMEDNRAQMRQLERDVEAATISESELMELEERERLLKDKVDAVALKMQTAHLDDKLSEVNRQLLDVETVIKRLSRERDELAAESAERIKLKFKKEELIVKERQISKILSDNERAFVNALGKVPSPQDLKKTLKTVIENHARSLKETAEASEKVRDKQSLARAARNAAMENLTRLEERRNALRSGLLEKLVVILEQRADVERLPSELENASKQYNLTKTKLDILKGMKRMFSPYLNHAMEHDACPVCERKFENESEKAGFIEKQRNAHVESEASERRMTFETSVLEAKLEKLRHLELQYKEYEMLRRVEIPKAQDVLLQCEKKAAAMEDEAKDVCGVLAQMEMEQSDLVGLEKHSDTVDRLLMESQILKRQIHEQEYRLDCLSESARTADDIKAELSAYEDKRSQMNLQKDKLRDEQETLSRELHNTSVRWRAAREDKIQADQKLLHQEKLKDDIKRLDEQNGEHDRTIQSLQLQLGTYRKELDKTIQDRESHRAKKSKEEQDIQERLGALQTDCETLRHINMRIDEYVLGNKDVKLKETIDRMAACAELQLQLEKDIEAILEKIKERETAVQDQVLLKREIEDNLRFRKLVNEERRLAEGNQRLAQVMADKGAIANVEGDLRGLQEVYNKCRDEVNKAQGTVAAYEANIERNKMELRQPTYKDIDARCRVQFIQLKATEKANKDLDKYYNALDKALMRFHTMKMEEINKIIKELWQQTYRGQDIDFLEIRSDSEGAGTRSYSYRVVMRSGDAELDMRGRCSAGQKVLASLIIRLALAETFCLNCGILALDEPTTNLDRANAEGLAAALLR
ncbi:hypothetical protein CBR_g44539 [Chara braunii]|uniref:Rad50/SbcC-type AAA domain-containing protein n=1 Tax=Chara braunii TaxID=69332 RepID=A0A388LXX2_CHABU|nr:hypothetical protein CBR_g44539 [Chara braunii]|eukprot:GBG87082.1 hypothetical protein CBR_g44539 [Chara braunii]